MFTHSQIRNISASTLTSMTEAELADWYRQQGKIVLCHNDRYWEAIFPGFYQPIHWLARLKTEQATSPTILGWGFRTTLHDADAASANGTMPIHLLSDVEGYTLKRFSSNRRRHLRKCHEQVQIVELVDPTPLQEQGYEVVLSATQRTQYLQAPSRKDYLATLSNYIDPSHRLVLAGFINGKLGGYLAGYAVDQTAYFENLYIATEVLTTNINFGLVYEFVQACRRSNIFEVVNGLHSPEDQPLCVFKESIGFPVQQIPSKVWIHPIAESLIRWKYPYKYYRLTGKYHLPVRNAIPRVWSFK